MKYISLYIIIVLKIVACNSDREETSDDYYNYEYKGERQIELDSLHFKSIELESNSTSLQGMVFVKNDTLQFLDTGQDVIFRFDDEGNQIGETLGRGEGPQEIPGMGLMSLISLPDGGYFFLGSSNDFYEFNSDLERTHSGRFDWQRETSQEVLENKSVPEENAAYNFDYQFGSASLTSSSENYVYLPLSSGPPQYTNFNLTTDLYAEQARVMARIERESGKLEAIGRLSPKFAANEDIRMFSNIHFDVINDDTIAFTFKPDSLIYLADKDFNVHTAFGKKGSNMDMNYTQPLSEDMSDSEYPELVMHEIINRGYYTSLQYFEEQDVMFRAYRRGGEAEHNGLQIYRDHQLIGDVSTPKKQEHEVQGQLSFSFKVVGYSEPYFYSNAFIDAEEEEIKVYRFSLPESGDN